MERLGVAMLRPVLVLCVLCLFGVAAIAQSKSKDPMTWRDILNKAGPPPAQPPASAEPEYVPEIGDDVFGPNPLKHPPKDEQTQRQPLQERGGLKVVNVGSYDVLYVRQLPTDNSKIVGMIPPDGTGIVYLGEREENWILVRYEDAEGWVNIHFIAKENE